MQAGEILDGKYRLTRQLRTAWQATGLAGGNHYLLKPAAGFIDPPAAEWLGQIWHPGLPRLLDRTAGADQEIYYVFEYLEGQPLSAAAAANGGRVPCDRLMPLMLQAAEVIGFLHRQDGRALLHLDIKPEHWLLDEQGRISLIDFDAARFQDPASERDLPGRVALTPDYAAPELLAGRPCPGSDLYALGLSFLCLLTGLPPSVCRSQPLPAILGEFPDALPELFGRCLSADPTFRYSDAEQLAEAIKAIISPEKPATERPAVTDPQLAAPLLCVWGDAEFGCELAAVLGMERQVMVVDADLLNPQADFLLGAREPGRLNAPAAVRHGLDLLLADEQRGRLDVSGLRRIAQSTRAGQVRVLTSGASLDYYELYSVESLFQVLRLARQISDLVVVLCSRFVFDAFTCLCLHASERILIPVSGDAGAIRAAKRSVEFLASRQQLDTDKISFAAFPYYPEADLSWGTLDELSGGHFAGFISDQKERRRMKNGAAPYAAALTKTNSREYRRLLRRISLPPTGKQVTD